jgi:membrane-bound ClpP family serine protease
MDEQKNKDWMRDPIWQFVGVVISFMSLVLPFIEHGGPFQLLAACILFLVLLTMALCWRSHR